MAEFKEGTSVADTCAKMTAQQLVDFAHATEVAERYDDMLEAVKPLPGLGAMDDERRNLFSVAFKNVVGARRASWRVLKGIEDKAEKSGESKEAALAGEYRERVEAELTGLCGELLRLIADLCKGEDKGSVFFNKMAGDYHRYMAEYKTGADRDTAANAAQSKYKAATALAESGDIMQPTDPIRLGLALNYSVFNYEILHEYEEAKSIAKKAFDSAVEDLDRLGELEYKDATLIMQLIRDNLTLWASEADEEQAVAPEDDGTAVQDL